MTILEVNNISKNFGTSEVLRNVSFSMSKGETLAVIGASGSGKTTLLRCLNFLEFIDEGSISVNGRVLYDASVKNRHEESSIRELRLHFGLVFQSFNLFPQYTALENVTLASLLTARKSQDFKRNKKEITGRIQKEGFEILQKMGLELKSESYPHQLSGGQQQRVAIARALSLKPDILCFDEPTSALDPELTGEVLKVIRELAEDRMTMIIVTHEMKFAREVADTIIFLDEGIIIEQGNPAEILDNPKNERIKRFLERYESR